MFYYDIIEMDRYLTPSHTQQFELVIKRSRFITTIAHVENRRQAKQSIEHIKTQYHDANHNCWAFISGMPKDLNGIDQSDDGEPKGTAGKPILNVLQHSGLGHILVVVTRYFGGIKLGAGGLVRAYSQSTSEALKQLKTQEQLIRTFLSIRLPYSLLGKTEHWLNNQGIEQVSKVFDSQVELEIAVPLKLYKQLPALLNVIGNGEIKLLD